MCGIYREKISEKKIIKEVCNGHVTVARGMGWEGSRLSSQRSYDRWGKGGRGRGNWEGGGGGGVVGERRKGRGPDRPATLGPSGPPL